MKSTDAEASSKEVFKVLEDDQPDLFLMDGAAAAESDFAKMILNNSTPEEFVEVLKELGYQLNLATTLLPKRTLASATKLWLPYRRSTTCITRLRTSTSPCR